MMHAYTIGLALDNGNLWARMGNGRYWKLRRNGRTQYWKTRPSEFRIPVKAGLKAYGAVTHTSLVSDDRTTGPEFLVSETDPNK